MGGTLKKIGQIGLGVGAAAAAPFTAGTSLALLPAILGGGSAALGLFGGGGNKGPSAPSTNPNDLLAGLSQTQVGVLNDLIKQYTVEREMRDKLTQPAIDYYSAIAGGDKTKAMQANAPVFSAIAEQQRAAQGRIMNEVPRGVGQEFALSQVPMQAADAASRAIYEPFISSFGNLANIGAQYGQSSLQTLGGGLRAGEAAGQSLTNLIDINSRKRSSTLGFLGDLIGSVVPSVIGGFTNGGSRNSGGSSGGGGTIPKPTFGTPEVKWPT